uniref:Uncharacterized protein n=1 Tax=Ursus americanus TaxID=9643 RepID=A0A452RKZ2_URSAM
SKKCKSNHSGSLVSTFGLACCITTASILQTDQTFSSQPSTVTSFPDHRLRSPCLSISHTHHRIFTESPLAHGLEHSFSWHDHSHFLSSPRFSHLNSFTKRTVTPDSPSIKEDATSSPMDGTSPPSKKEEYESKKGKM